MAEQHRFLLRTSGANAVDDFDTVLAASSYATLENRDEVQQTVHVEMTAILNNQEFTPTEQFDFLASQVKALTTPHDITNRNIPYDFLGLAGSPANPTFTVDDVEVVVQGRLNCLKFSVMPTNGPKQFFTVRDDGGKELVPVADVTIHELFPGEPNGWTLINKKAVYSGGTLVSPAELIPGRYAIMILSGQQYTDDVRGGAADNTLFETSILANSFKTLGTEKTYTRTAGQTDWGTGYTVTYYERTIAGSVIGMIDPESLPDELIAQHGALPRKATA